MNEPPENADQLRAAHDQEHGAAHRHTRPNAGTETQALLEAQPKENTPARRGFWVFAMAILCSCTSIFYFIETRKGNNGIPAGRSNEKGEISKGKEIIPADTTNEETPQFLHFGCENMTDVNVTRAISNGHAKIAYEVQLGTSGQKPVVKRCLIGKCLFKEKLKNEASYLERLQSHYGRDQTVGYYGGCFAPPKEDNDEYLRSISKDFAAGGPATLTELGQPLIPTLGTKGGHKRHIKYRECLARHFTEADVENFRTIARQYAGYPDYPLLFATPGGKNSHVWAEQYVLVKAGIRHIDLDNLFRYNQTYEEALELNCATVRKVTFRPDLNCTLEHSLENPVKDMNLHIDVPQADSECTAPKDNGGEGSNSTLAGGLMPNPKKKKKQERRKRRKNRGGRQRKGTGNA